MEDKANKKAANYDVLKVKCLTLLPEINTITELAKELGVNRNTIYVWRKNDPDFVARWNEVIENMYQVAMESLTAKAEIANESLLKEITAGDNKVNALKLYYDILNKRKGEASGHITIEADF